MNFAIRFSGGQRADFGNHDFEGILTNSLERFARRLKQVFLYLEDINGPRGGVDKQCRCVLHLRRMPPVVIQDEDENTYALIHRVANRAAYALSQQAARKSRQTQRTRRRSERITAFAGRDEHDVAGIESVSRQS